MRPGIVVKDLENRIGMIFDLGKQPGYYIIQFNDYFEEKRIEELTPLFPPALTNDGLSLFRGVFAERLRMRDHREIMVIWIEFFLNQPKEAMELSDMDEYLDKIIIDLQNRNSIERYQLPL